MLRIKRDLQMQTLRRTSALRKFAWGRGACAVFVLCASVAMAQTKPTFTTLHQFEFTDGAVPFAPLVQATNGNFYGTTNSGGSSSNNGAIFEITPSGALTPLDDLGAAGYSPYSGLIQATNGSIYGAAFNGGLYGAGTVYEITLGGALDTLYNFCQSGCPDGGAPYAGLVQATNGDLYGTTHGGIGDESIYSYGTVFKIPPSGGTLTTLHSFCSQGPPCTDGSYPYAGLVQATNGDLYGTTYSGGANNAGTVFKITPNGTLKTLYSFCSQPSCTDGGYPYAGLVQASNGDLYGTTLGNGTNPFGDSSYGTVYKITLSGKLTTIYTFCSQSECTDGALPYAGLIQATDGNLYGATLSGGVGAGGCEYAEDVDGCGTVFRIDLSGKHMKTLYSFCVQSGCPDGSGPYGGLIQATDGTFYGTASRGGSQMCGGGCGTVFSLSDGLGPFVEPQTTSGEVGAAVTILGNNLTGASSVTFNGTAAVFTVNSTGTAISTTVPTGATTGTVQVVTAGNTTVSSNVPFTVKQ